MLKAATKKIRALSGATSRVWFSAEYEFPATQRIEPPAPRDLPGLIFHHQIDPEGAVDCLLTYWETRGDFDASRALLEERIGAAKLRRATWVRRLTVHKEPFWKRVTAYGVLLHLVAILGALAALEKHYAWLLEKPSITVDLGGSMPIDLVEGSALSTSLLLTNQRATVPAEVSVEAFLVGQSGSMSSIISGDPYSISGAERLDLPIRTGPLASGRYLLEVHGRGRSGHLRGWQPLRQGREVHVWSKDPWTELAVDRDTPLSRQLGGLLHVGEDAPDGLDCQATLTEEPLLRFRRLQFRGMATVPQSKSSPAGSVAILTWETLPATRFSRIPFSLYFEGQPSAGWARLLPGHLAVECSKRASAKRDN